MEIKITPEAHNDILGIYNYVKKDGEQIAGNQVTYIYDGIEKLSSFPNMGTALQKHVERPTKLRYLVIHKGVDSPDKTALGIDTCLYHRPHFLKSILGIEGSPQ